MTDTRSETAASDGSVRVLVFTCSRYRPMMLRHCILQFQHQTYPADLAIYVNYRETDPADVAAVRYEELIEDAAAGGRSRLFLTYGETLTPQRNWMVSLHQVSLEDYDLFLKVDDDDIYLRHYVEHVVADFVANRWDYSGTYSYGALNGRRWRRGDILKDLGMPPEDVGLDMPRHMPPSIAFSRAAARAISAIDTNSGDFEDMLWRRLMVNTPSLKIAARRDRNFIYNIHGGNASTGHLLNP